MGITEAQAMKTSKIAVFLQLVRCLENCVFWGFPFFFSRGWPFSIGYLYIICNMLFQKSRMQMQTSVYKESRVLNFWLQA